MHVGFLVLSVALAGGVEGVPSTVLNAQQLQEAVKQVDHFKARDAFSAPSDQSMIANRPFEIEVPLLYDKTPGWSYDPTEQKLKIILMPSFMFGSTKLPKSFQDAVPPNGGSGWAFVDSVTSRSQYSASNAFGVVARVKSEAGRSYGVVPIGGTRFNADPEWEVAIPMASAEARKIAPRLRLRLQGTIHPVTGTTSITCFDEYMEPTLASPRETLYRKCLIGARINAISVVDSGTGDVLREWGPLDAAS